jgi:hypothetical protein
MDQRNGFRRGFVWVSLVICLACALAGCSRRFYRNQTDREVDEVLCEKDIFPEWKIENMHVYPDPRARHGDPSNPDRPPMPPDDPAAQMLGPNPQKPRHAGRGRVEGTGWLDLMVNWDMENRSKRALERSAPLRRRTRRTRRSPRSKRRSVLSRTGSRTAKSRN